MRQSFGYSKTQTQLGNSGNLLKNQSEFSTEGSFESLSRRATDVASDSELKAIARLNEDKAKLTTKAQACSTLELEYALLLEGQQESLRGLEREERQLSWLESIIAFQN